jgi:CheY-like chemotaxis protein
MRSMRRVLVVEDSVSARAFVRAVLEVAEFAAASRRHLRGRRGEQRLRRHAPAAAGPYDLIVTDINMADINGLELIRFIRKSEHHHTTPLVIISTLTRRARRRARPRARRQRATSPSRSPRAAARDLRAAPRAAAAGRAGHRPAV